MSSGSNKKQIFFCTHGKISITQYFRHFFQFSIFNTTFCCWLMNIILTEFWTVKLLIHKLQPPLKIILLQNIRDSTSISFQTNHFQSISSLVESPLDAFIRQNYWTQILLNFCTYLQHVYNKQKCMSTFAPEHYKMLEMSKFLWNIKVLLSCLMHP